MPAVIVGDIIMKTLTIRGIDEQLEKKIKAAATKDSMSINQFLLNLIKKKFWMHLPAIVAVSRTILSQLILS